VQVWQGIVFEGVRKISHPVERVMRALENDLRNYIGGEVFRGGRLHPDRHQRCRSDLRGKSRSGYPGEDDPPAPLPPELPEVMETK